VREYMMVEFGSEMDMLDGTLCRVVDIAEELFEGKSRQCTYDKLTYLVCCGTKSPVQFADRLALLSCNKTPLKTQMHETFPDVR
jgi:hypothetical protein